MSRRAKIVGTIGPATRSLDRLRALAEAGMDVARLNFSHGERAVHGKTIRDLRAVSEEKKQPIGILMDLQGPKVRTGQLEESKGVELESGQRVRLTPDPVRGSATRIHIDYEHLRRDLNPGDRVLLDDGRLELRVVEPANGDVLSEVVNGGLLGENKGVNFPGIELSLSLLSAKDRADLAFGIEQGVDMIAMSFVRRAKDLIELREAIEDCSPECDHIPVIAKLERPEAIDHLDEILELCEGVMVARGDLGIEVSPERVPSLQKWIIQKANARLRTVITATQMLESMMRNPRPTRAEASDVANAVFDGSDALMLSGETAVGRHPLEAVRTMNRIILDAEAHKAEWGLRLGDQIPETHDDAVATTRAARALADDRGVQAIAVFTRSGRTARLTSKTRPQVPILAFTPDATTYQQLSLLWGTQPHLVPMASSVEEMISHVEEALVLAGNLQPGQQVVIVASLPVGRMGPANFTLLHTIDSPKRH